MSAELPISDNSNEPVSNQGQWASNSPEPSPLPGVKLHYFGDYELLEEIARGGMGIVYKARQLSLNRLVALKMILSGHLATEEEVKRFRSEAAAAASLDYPNIVPIYEIGEHEGRHYFTMRLVEGENLAHQIPRFKNDPESAVKLMVTVANAVHHAHQRGILHRDLKPSNILVDSDAQPHVTDFGLAKLMERDSGLTQSGSAVGTPNYMSPEQAAGKMKQLTTTSDVFSLGAILYQMLTGQPPFHADTPLGTLKKVVEAEPHRPRFLNRRVDRDLETICLKCLEKHPDRRYGSAEALADDLERWLHHEPIQGRPSGAWERTLKWSRRRPAVAALVIVTFVAITGFVAQTLLNKAQLKRERDYAVMQQKRAEVEAHQAELHQAESLSAQAAALSSANWNEAKARYTEALAVFRRIGESPLLASLGIWDRYRRFPQPISTIALGDRALISPNGKRALSRYEDGGIALWNLPRNRPLRSWSADLRYWVPDHCFSAEGTAALVRSGTNGVLEVVSAESGETLHVVKGAENDVGPVALSPDVKMAASGNQHGVVTVWDLGTGKVIKTFDRGNSPLESLCFSPDGRMLASSSGITNVSLTFWDSHIFEELQTLTLQLTNNNPVYHPSLKFSADSRFCLFGDRRTTYRLNTSSWSQRRVLENVESDTYDVALSPDGRAALCLTANFGTFDDRFEVTVFNLDTGDKIQSFGEYDASSLRMMNLVARALSPDWRTLLAGMYVWPVSLNSESRLFKGHGGRVRSVAWSPDDRLAGSGSEDGTVKVWDVETGRELGTIEGSWGAVRAVAFHPKGQQVFFGAADGTIRLWSLPDGTQTRSFSGHLGGVTCLAISRDGLLLVGGSATTLEVWEVATGRRIRSFRSEPADIHRLGTSNLVGFVSNVAISPDGRLAISGSHYGAAKVWEISTGKEVSAISHSSPLVGAGFTPDSRRCFIASLDGFISLFDAEKPEVALTLRDNSPNLHYTPSELYSATLSPNGRFLISCGVSWQEGRPGQAALKIWDVSSGKAVQTIEADAAALECGAFSTDGLRLLTCGPGSDVLLWDFSRGAKYAEFEESLAKAWKTPKGAPNAPEALSVIGEWYAFRGAWDWAAEVLEKLPKAGRAPVASLTLARSYWAIGKLDRAREEFALLAGRDKTIGPYASLCMRGVEGSLFHNQAGQTDSSDSVGNGQFEALVPEGLQTDPVALNLLSGQRTVPNRDIIERLRGKYEVKPHVFKGLAPKGKIDGIFRAGGPTWPPDMAGIGPFYLLRSQDHYFLLTPANFAKVFGPIASVSEVMPYLEAYETLFENRFGAMVKEDFQGAGRGKQAPPELTRVEETKNGFRVRVILYQVVHEEAFYAKTVLLKKNGIVKVVEPAKMLKHIGSGIVF